MNKMRNEVPQVQNRRALFLLATDKLAGAERVTVTIAQFCAENKIFDEVEIFVLSRASSGTLSFLSSTANLSIHYSGGLRERNGIYPFIRHILRKKYSFVFSSLYHLNALCSLLRRLRVLRTEFLVTRESTSIFSHPDLKNTLVLKLLMALYGGQDLIVCQTKRIEEQFHIGTRNRHFVRTVTIPNFLERERIIRQMDRVALPPTNFDPNMTNVIWCGSLIRRKRPDIAIESMSRIMSLNPNNDFQLYLVGKGPMQKEIEGLISKYGISERVTLCGHLDNPISLMARCEIGLMTSDLEGFPNAMLEMLAAGVNRVVITDCAGGLTEVPCVTVVPKGSVEECASAIVSARSSANELKALEAFFEGRTVQNYVDAVFHRLNDGN